MSEGPLEQLNRVAIVVGALAIVFAALVVALLAWGAPGETIARVVDLAGYLRRHNDGETKVMISLAAAVVTLLMLTVITVELTPSPSQKVRVQSMTSGDAVITTSQIAARIDSEVTQIPHIAQCAAIVARRGKRVEVVLDLHVDAGASLSQTADEACRRAHTLVEQQLGIEMAAMPRARLHYRELRLHPVGSTRESRTATSWATDSRAGQGYAADSRTGQGYEQPRTAEADLDQRG